MHINTCDVCKTTLRGYPVHTCRTRHENIVTLKEEPQQVSVTAAPTPHCTLSPCFHGLVFPRLHVHVCMTITGSYTHLSSALPHVPGPCSVGVAPASLQRSTSRKRTVSPRYRWLLRGSVRYRAGSDRSVIGTAGKYMKYSHCDSIICTMATTGGG